MIGAVFLVLLASDTPDPATDLLNGRHQWIAVQHRPGNAGQARQSATLRPDRSFRFGAASFATMR
jgi:hypothetical protein